MKRPRQSNCCSCPFLKMEEEEEVVVVEVVEVVEVVVEEEEVVMCHRTLGSVLQDSPLRPWESGTWWSKSNCGPKKGRMPPCQPAEACALE